MIKREIRGILLYEILEAWEVHEILRQQIIKSVVLHSLKKLPTIDGECSFHGMYGLPASVIVHPNWKKWLILNEILLKILLPTKFFS